MERLIMTERNSGVFPVLEGALCPSGRRSPFGPGHRVRGRGVLRSSLRRADGGLSLRDSDISWCSLRGSGVPVPPPGVADVGGPSSSPARPSERRRRFPSSRGWWWLASCLNLDEAKG